jgi:hypothetical protein
MSAGSPTLRKNEGINPQNQIVIPPTQNIDRYDIVERGKDNKNICKEIKE